MAKPIYTLDDAEMTSILAEVERDLATVLKSESKRLAKAKEDGSDDAPPSDDSSADSGPPDGASAPPSDASPSPSPDASASPGGAPPGAPPDASADPAASAQGSPMDVDSLKQEYSQLPPQELEMHYVACKAALMESMQGQSAGGAPGAPPGAPPDASAGLGGPPPGASPSPAGPPPGVGSPSPSAPPPPGSPDPSAPPAFKGEMSAGKQLDLGGKGNGGPVTKSENEKVLEARLADQDAQIEGLAKAVDLLFSTPQRKAVTTIAALGKSESGTPETKTFTHAETIAQLNDRARDPKLAKNDRILINKFCVGSAEQHQIAHLLK